MLPTRLRRTAREFWGMPALTINLMRSAAAGNDPSYDRLVVEHYREARRRRLLLRSLVRYPLPFRPSDVRMRFARLRLLRAVVSRLVGLGGRPRLPGMANRFGGQAP